MKTIQLVVLIIALYAPVIAQVTPQWIQFFASTTGEHDMGFRIATDAAGNLITAAVFQPEITSWDLTESSFLQAYTCYS